SSSTAYYKAANKRYFTFEVVDELRGNYIRQKKEKLLVSLLEEAVKKLPNNPDTLGLLAEEYAYIKEYEKAESLYKKAIKNSRVYIDKFHYAKKYSKNVLLATYRSAEAIEVLKAAAGSYKDKELDLYRALAEAYLFNLNYAEAKAYINKIKISRGKKFSSADKKLESVIDDYIERSKKGYFSSVNENNKTQSKEVPSVLATTSVNANWLIVNPDQRHFLATNGNGTYRLWDSKNFSVINEYAGAVLDKSYTKTMTKPVYSPDGRYIAYATEFNGDLGSVMLVYDLKDQRFSHQLPMSKKTSALAWSPDGSELAIWNYGRLIKYSLNDKRVIQQGEVKDQDGADLMKWTANGKYIALLERASTGSIRIFDADTMRQLHRLDQASWPHALGVSKDGRYIFSADNRRKLHRWDTDKNFEHKKISIPVLGRLIEPHPERKEIIINDWDGRNSLALVDYEKMEVIKEERTGKAELRMHFINKGKQILAANFKDDFYEVYDAKTLALVKKYKGESTVVTGGAFANKKRNKLIVWDQEGLHVWSVLTGKKLHSWEGKFQSVVSDPVNADKFYTLEKIEKAKLTQISAYDLKDFSKEDVGGPNFIVDEWGIDNNSMVLSGRHFKPMAKGSFLGVVMVIDLQEKEHQQVVVDMVTNSLEYRYLMKSRFKHLAISPDKKHIAIVTAWVDGWKRKEKTSKVTRVFNVETGSQVAKIEQAGELVFVDNETLAIASGTSLKKGDKLYSIVSAEVDGKLDKKAEGIVIGTHDKLSYRIKFEERNLLINVGKDNKLLYQDLKNNKHILSVIAKRNNEWIAYLPTGEYTASKNGDDKVVWSINGKNLTKENSANQYKREDVISKKLDEVAVAN
ncbi:MAG: PD40 domain-containing protein, partial [Gammaproteobacteria bacterium]|nr:PD40 domain-containing protein [Gammaproteobacteria bacterium]